MDVTYSRHLADWLVEQQVSLAITTYQANKLMLVGVQPNGRIGVFQRTFPRCMGLWSDGQTVWMASQFPKSASAGRSARNDGTSPASF